MNFVHHRGREDFRVAYREVHMVQSLLDNSPILLLTATMTKSLKLSTLHTIGMEESDVEVVARLPNRDNVYLDVHATPGMNHETELLWLARDLQKKKEQ